jgi:hypothetical protein
LHHQVPWKIPPEASSDPEAASSKGTENALVTRLTDV